MHMTKKTPATKPAELPVKAARLSNAMRDSFIAAVMADVPQIDFESRIRDAVNKASAKTLPAAIKKLLADPELSQYVATRSCTLNRHDGILAGSYITFRLPHTSDEDLDKLATEVAETIIKEWNQQVEKTAELRQRLRAVAYTCNTTTTLAEAFPEFARYLPRDEAQATRNLPALTNVVAEFVKAGWPKGKVAA
jgi:hypothetical protein